MAEVKIPIQTKYDGKGFDLLQKDAARAQRELVRQTRQQLAEHRKVVSLTNKLDRDLAKEAREREKQIRQNNQALRDWGGALLTVGAGVAAFTANAIKLSDEAEITERSFVGLSGGAERAAANMAAMDSATRGLISTQEQQAIANQLLGMRIADNATELETVVEGARRLGKAFKGMGAAEAANDFALMLSNMSYLRLDQFGLSAGKVRERVNELKAAGMGAEEAFKTAVFEEMNTTLGRLGPEIENTTNRVEKLNAKWLDFQVAFGGAVDSVADSSGAFDTSVSLLERLTAGANAWGGVGEQAKLLQRGMEILNEEGESTLGWLEEIPILGNAIRGADFWGSQIFRLGELQQAMVQAGEESEELKRQQAAAAEEAANISKKLQDEAKAAEEAAAAQDELAKRLEKVNEIRRDTAREIVAIEERNAEDISKVWADYWKDQEKEWKDHNKTLKSIEKKAGAEQKKADSDLAKSLAQLDKDTNKQIRDAQKRAATDERHESKRRQVDALADERLFNFELQELAAEGQGNAIRSAIERRAIEEQIAKEKAAVESQIEAEKRQDEIAGIREAAAAKRASLKEDFAEEKALRAERLAEDLAAEQAAYADRMTELRDYREQKLSELEASKLESLETLARELAESGELTKNEMAALIPAAATLGEEAGKAFAEGINRGVETNLRVDEMLGEGRSSSRQPVSRRPSRPGQRFQFGGVVGGPIGSPQMILAHGGEPVGIPPISLSVSVGQIGAGMDSGRVEKIVEPLFQRFVNDILIPAFS